MDEGEEVDCSSVVSCGDVPAVLELVKASLDAVSRLVDFEVVGDRALAGWIAGDDGGGADHGNRHPGEGRRRGAPSSMRPR